MLKLKKNCCAPERQHHHNTLCMYVLRKQPLKETNENETKAKGGQATTRKSRRDNRYFTIMCPSTKQGEGRKKCARATHRLVNNLNDAGLHLGDDRRVTGGDTVLARATRDDHLTQGGGGGT